MKLAIGALALMLAAPAMARAATILDTQRGFDAPPAAEAQSRVGGQHGVDEGRGDGGLQIAYSSGGVYRDANWDVDSHPRPRHDWDAPRVPSPSPAPEPDEWMLLLAGGGVVGLLLYARRRTASSAPQVR